jgi:hypothetical protein
MCKTSVRMLTRLDSSAPMTMLRAGCVALFVCVSACGGGNDGAPPSSMSATASTPAPNPTPLAFTPAPATAQSIDSGATGNPVSLRVARSANGDGFAVWQADDGTRHNLLANRYRAAAAAWGNPTTIEASNADIDDFDLAVDASGNAVVVWHEVSTGDPRLERGVVMSARFDTSAGAWATPVPLNTDAFQPRVASDGTGALLAVYVARSVVVRGRFFDPVSGAWQPEAAIEQNTTGTGFSSGPLALLDGSGNALVAFHNARSGAGVLASNYYSRTGGGWGRLPTNEAGFLGGVPGSLTLGSNGRIQLTASADGNFMLAWNPTVVDDDPQSGQIVIASFTSRTRTWSAPQTVVPGSTQKNVQLQRMGSAAGGSAHLLWTESDGVRTALKAIRIDGAVCNAPEEIDRAVGGGAARADLGVDPLGHAITIWQQFEGGRPDDGSRSNVAINRFDGNASLWAGAVLAETQPGNATSPRASASGGQALLGWIQSEGGEGGANRVKALLKPLASTPSP